MKGRGLSPLRSYLGQKYVADVAFRPLDDVAVKTTFAPVATKNDAAHAPQHWLQGAHDSARLAGLQSLSRAGGQHALPRKFGRFQLGLVRGNG